jgi:hypothetical protein
MDESMPLLLRAIDVPADKRMLTGGRNVNDY